MTLTRVLLLTKYSYSAASSRYRAYQYVEFLEQAGFDPVISPLFPDTYLQNKFTSSSRLRWAMNQVTPVAKCLAQRAWFLLRQASKYDAVYLQYEALPYLPPLFDDTLFQTNRRVVVDYDDAIHLTYDSKPLLRPVFHNKIPTIVRRSRWVIAANKNLAAWARTFNNNVTIIPTSVDLRRYPPLPPPPRRGGKPVIGWIGTPNTAAYLRMLEQPLLMLRKQHEFIFKVIGAPGFTMDGIETVSVPWSEATEVDQLRTFDVGVMPVPDDRWGRGKSGLKLIQYLAAGVPAIGSGVGANRDILDGGHYGLLAHSGPEWTNHLALLLDNPAERERLASSGRRWVEAEFSLQRNAPRFVDVLRHVAGS